MASQTVITEYACCGLPEELKMALGGKRILAVCDKGLLGQKRVSDFLAGVPCAAVFSNFEPNPDFASVVNGVKLLEREQCRAVLAIGGGSSIDVAKCIKHYAFSGASEPFPAKTPEENDITLISVPTTAGTGSEATRFAVVYHKGEKQSVEHSDLIPEFVIFDASFLETLPAYQRASTGFDALCHAVESMWSVNSTVESRRYSLKAIEGFFVGFDGYMRNELAANKRMLACANLAGRAINISKTTAAHAMSYKITKLKGISHGHSAALCLPPVWRHIAGNAQSCSDKRGEAHLSEALALLNRAFGCETAEQSILRFESLLASSIKSRQFAFSSQDMDELVSSVNLQRLANSPVPFDEDSIRGVYAAVNTFLQRNGG